MRQAERRARTVAALLDAAATSFASHGYDGTSLESVAMAAGVSKGAVYAHFTSKLEIFLVVLERTLAEAGRRLESARERLAAGRPAIEAAQGYFGRPTDALHVGIMSVTWQLAAMEALVRERLEEFRRQRVVNLGEAAIEAGYTLATARETADVTAKLIDAWTLEYRLDQAAGA